MKNRLFRKNREAGQGMAEYIILVVFIAVVAITVVSLFGSQIRNWFGQATVEMTGDSSKSGTFNAVDESALKSAVDKEAKDMLGSGGGNAP